MAGGVSKVAGEDARKRSVRLATKRVSSVLKYMDLVGNLAGAGYQLTDDEKTHIVKAVFDSYDKMRRRFDGEVIAEDRFKL